MKKFLPFIAYCIGFSFSMLLLGLGTLILPILWSVVGSWALVVSIPIVTVALWATFWFSDKTFDIIVGRLD